MKIALVADPHFGIKKGTDLFLENQIRYFCNEFVPYLIKNKITHIIFLGDMFDNRHFINVKVKDAVYKLFEEQLCQFEIYILLGNHDTYYRSTNTIHSLQFFKKFSNITVVDDVEKFEINNRQILMVSWQPDMNAFVKRVAEKNIQRLDICLGHFDISGFKLNKKKVSEDGLDSGLFFNNYTLTFSGHFHTRSKSKYGEYEIIYIGAPYHLTRQDMGEKRGFCVLDLDTLHYRFVNSQNTIKYTQIEFPKPFTSKMIEGNIIDVQVNYDGQLNEQQLETYIERIEMYKPALPPNVIMVNKLLDLQEENSTVKMKSIRGLMREYVNGLNLTNKVEIIKLMDELYNEAKNSDI